MQATTQTAYDRYGARIAELKRAMKGVEFVRDPEVLKEIQAEYNEAMAEALEDYNREIGLL